MRGPPMRTDEDRPKARRGFAAMDPEKRRAIAKLGGAAGLWIVIISAMMWALKAH